LIQKASEILKYSVCSVLRVIILAQCEDWLTTNAYDLIYLWFMFYIYIWL